MSKSIYTTALEFGHEHFFEGVKYNEVKSFVEEKHKTKFDYYSERAFIDWFIEAFSSTNISGKHDNLIHSIKLVLQKKYLNRNIDTHTHEIHSDRFYNDFKFFITGESDRKLLEYKELQEARQSARQAFYTALGAIFISILAVIAAPFFDYLFQVYIKPLLVQ